MESMVLIDRRTPRSELAAGLGGSIAAHVLMVVAAVLVPALMPHHTTPIAVYSVNLVSLEDLGGGPAPKLGSESGTSENARTETRNQPASRSKGSPVVPVRRLRVEDNARSSAEVKRIEPREAPRPVEVPSAGTSSIDKALDQMITKPKPGPKPEPVVQKRTEGGSSRDTGSKAQANAGSDRRNDSGATPSQGQGTGTAKGTPDGSSTGAAGGIAGGSGDGGKVASALLGLYSNKVREAISRQWGLVKELSEIKGLEALLLLVVRHDGSLVNVQIEKGSGNAMFDKAAEKAVRKAVPLPPLPDAITYPTIEFNLRFKPEGLS